MYSMSSIFPTTFIEIKFNIAPQYQLINYQLISGKNIVNYSGR